MLLLHSACPPTPRASPPCASPCMPCPVACCLRQSFPPRVSFPGTPPAAAVSGGKVPDELTPMVRAASVQPAPTASTARFGARDRPASLASTPWRVLWRSAAAEAGMSILDVRAVWHRPSPCLSREPLGNCHWRSPMIGAAHDAHNGPIFSTCVQLVNASPPERSTAIFSRSPRVVSRSSPVHPAPSPPPRRAAPARTDSGRPDLPAVVRCPAGVR
jgi:hypothetical protein